MPNRRSCILAACALILGPGAAWAQAPQAPAATTSVAPVTVQGVAPPKVIKKQTQSFVEAYAAAAPKLNLIARWRRSVCVQAVNLTPEQAAQVKARIEEVARGVGLKIDKPGCVANIQVVLSSQPQAFMDKLADENELLLGFHYPSDLKKLKTVTHPVQAWYETTTIGDGDMGDLFGANLRDADGHYVSPYDFAPLSRSRETLDAPDSPPPPACAGSLMTGCLRSGFMNVLVVMDSHAVEGKSLGAMADYAAVLALSQAKPAEACSPLPSIFDLLAKTSCPGRDPPDGLTPADAAFLTALYASGGSDVQASLDRGQMEDRMADILIKAQAVAGVKGH